jgi:transcriptional regulator with XRE-family HTH domain
MEAEALSIEAPDTFGSRLRGARLERSLTRRQLARSSHTTEQTITRYEHDLVHNPQEAIVLRIATALRVSPAWLLAGVEVSDRLLR